jgi:hypothetical protein
MSRYAHLADLGVVEQSSFSDEELASMRAANRVGAPAPRPEPAAFDLKACLRRYAKGAPKERSNYYSWSEHEWITADHGEPSREEAHFWLTAYALDARFPDHGTSVPSKDILAGGTYDGDVSKADAVKMIDDFHTSLRATFSYTRAGNFSRIGLVLSVLFGPRDAAELVLETLGFESSFMFSALQTIQAPADAAEREALLGYLTSYLDRADLSDRYAYESALHLTVLTAADGLYGRMVDAFKVVRGDFYYGIPSGIEAIMAELPAEAQLERWHTLRRDLRPAHGNRLFARVGWDALDELVAWTVSKKGADGTLDMILNYDSPRVAKVLVQLSKKGDFRARCEDALRAPSPWLIAGLMELATSRGNVRAVALDTLRFHHAHGQADLIAQMAPLMDEKVTRAVTTHVIDWEPRSRPPLPESKRPEWLAREVPNKRAQDFPVDRLPPLFTADGAHQLTDADRLAVVDLLSYTQQTTAKAEVLELVELVDRADLAAFGWAIYERWLTRFGKSKASIWCVYQLAHVGGDTELIELSKELKTWPKENKWRMAQDCLEVYRVNGSDAALMTLHDIAHRVKYKSVRSRAQAIVDEIAKARGLTEDELADRIIPDCGLEPDGSKVYDYGPRSFTLVFDSEFKPVFKDDARDKIVKSLPKPGVKDDADLAEAARADFKEVKKALKQVVTTQKPRLEQAMVTGRRWAPGDFVNLLARHPLMRHFASRLLWGVFHTSGKKKGSLDFCLRVDEEAELLDANDDPVSIPPDRLVGLVHPLELSDDVLKPWGAVFGDYEIVPPFPQLSRPTYDLSDQDPSSKALTGFPTATIAPGAVRGFIDKDGWQRGAAQDAGAIYDATKHFPAADVTACLNYSPGIYAGGAAWDEPQVIESVTFWKGQARWSRSHLELSKVPPTVLSEVRFSLAQLLDGVS